MTFYIPVHMQQSARENQAKIARPMVEETGASLLAAVHSSTQNNQWTECHICIRSFHFNRPLLQHLNAYRQRNTANLNVSSNIEEMKTMITMPKKEKKNTKSFIGTRFLKGIYKDLEEVYNKIELSKDS